MEKFFISLLENTIIKSTLPLLVIEQVLYTHI